MDLVHKGLEAMQALQAQTARAHEKFLETQAQASQTLAAMMTQTRQFADGIDFLAAPHFMPAREPLPDRSTAPNPPAVGSRNVRPHVPPPSVKPAPYAGQSEWKSASGPDRISGSVRNGPVNPIKFFGPDNGSGRFHLFGTGVKDTDRPVRDRQPPDRVS